MSVTAPPLLSAVGYAFSSSTDETFGGFFAFLDEARQECQGIAVGDLHWTTSAPGVWEATDPVTSTVYEIEARRY